MHTFSDVTMAGKGKNHYTNFIGQSASGANEMCVGRGGGGSAPILNAYTCLSLPKIKNNEGLSPHPYSHPLQSYSPGSDTYVGKNY